MLYSFFLWFATRFAVTFNGRGLVTFENDPYFEDAHATSAGAKEIPV